MWTVFIGILQPEAKDGLKDYYDRPFDLFTSYYDTNLYRIPWKWKDILGPSTQMDWGSWLYVCDRTMLKKFTDENIHTIVHCIPAEKCGQDIAKRERPKGVEKLPKAEWYGILEVELY